MSGLIPEEVIAQVRERTDIVQIIGEHVQLKRSGINFVGLCPFHDETAPSFNVNNQRQFYHCFGCHESGDVIRFLMKIEGRSFGEVVEQLADRANIEIPKASAAQAKAAAQRRSDRQQGLDLNLKVAKRYQLLLHGDQGRAARDYLRQRGIGEETATSFMVGYAPPSGNCIVQLLKSEKISMAFAERMGLIAPRHQGDGYHDRFWNRIIFPMIGSAGEILGFGGRLLGDGEGPKYINTPETPLFHKGEILFGLGIAASAMRKKGSAILVEGNFDVLQLHEHGFENAVAPMGTSLTPRQVQLLHRFAPEVVAIFDGDNAGQAAALKSVPLFVTEGLRTKVAPLTREHDPDSLLREKGPRALQKLVEEAQPAIDYMITVLQGQMEDSIPGRARVLEQIAPVVAKVQSDVERDLYIGRLAMTLDIDQRTVQRAVKGKRFPEVGRVDPATKAGAQSQVKLPTAEINVLGILVDFPHLVTRAEATGLTSLLTNSGVRATYQAARQVQEAAGDIDPAKLLQVAPDEVADALAKVLDAGAFASVGDPTRAFDDCVADLKRRQLERKLRDVANLMAQARSDKDSDSERALALRKVELEREIHETR